MGWGGSCDHNPMYLWGHKPMELWDGGSCDHNPMELWDGEKTHGIMGCGGHVTTTPWNYGMGKKHIELWGVGVM